jgi:hypothetical protein
MSQVMEPTLLQCFVKRSMHNIIWSFMIYMVNNKHNLDKVRLLKAYVARDGLRKYRNHQFRCHRISSYLFIHRTFFYFFYFFIFIFYRHYRQYWTITQQDQNILANYKISTELDNNELKRNLNIHLYQYNLSSSHCLFYAGTFVVVIAWYIVGFTSTYAISANHS